MVALNFKTQFADDVASGRKCQSIRAPRKDGRDPVPGNRLQLYTGMRTRACRKLGDANCIRVRPVQITKRYVVIDGYILPPPAFSTANTACRSAAG